MKAAAGQPLSGYAVVFCGAYCNSPLYQRNMLREITLSAAEQMGEEVEDGVEEFDQPAPEGRAVIHVVPFAEVVALSRRVGIGGSFGLRRVGGGIRLAGGGAGNGFAVA